MARLILSDKFGQDSDTPLASGRTRTPPKGGCPSCPKSAAPAAADQSAERRRLARNARSRRSYRRSTRHERIGKYTITEDLANFLVWDGLAPDQPTTAAVDIGVAQIIAEYLKSRRKHYF